MRESTQVTRARGVHRHPIQNAHNLLLVHPVPDVGSGLPQPVKACVHEALTPHTLDGPGFTAQGGCRAIMEHLAQVIAPGGFDGDTAVAARFKPRSETHDLCRMCPQILGNAALAHAGIHDGMRLQGSSSDRWLGTSA